MGIPRKVPVSKCSELVRTFSEIYHWADYYANKCMKEERKKDCIDALRELEHLKTALSTAQKEGCVKDVGDFIDEVGMAIWRVRRIASR